MLGLELGDPLLARGGGCRGGGQGTRGCGELGFERGDAGGQGRLATECGGELGAKRLGGDLLGGEALLQICGEAFPILKRAIGEGLRLGEEVVGGGEPGAKLVAGVLQLHELDLGEDELAA